MENRHQEMVFSLDSYKFGKTEEEARNNMWKDITIFLQMLLKNEYIAVIYDDDIDIIVVQYGHNEKIDAWGAPNPVWITEEEEFTLKNQENSEDIPVDD